MASNLEAIWCGYTENIQLSNVENLKYLKDLLKWTALKCIQEREKNVPSTENNCDIAIGIKDGFGKKINYSKVAYKNF